MRTDIYDALKIVLVTFLVSALIMPLMKRVAIHVGAVDVPRKKENSNIQRFRNRFTL